MILLRDFIVFTFAMAAWIACVCVGTMLEGPLP